jgi:hypothetical protein
VRPVEPGAREQPHVAAIEARMHAVAVELDFVQPLISFRRGVDQPGELRGDPFRQAGADRRAAGVLSLAPCRKRRAVTMPAHAPLDSASAYPSATLRRAPTVRAAS